MTQAQTQILDRITDFADAAHSGQTRRYTPENYIAHPIRVMETCRRHTNDLAICAAAVLHDVAEDTPVTKEQLHTFLQRLMDKDTADRTVSLVAELTDVYTEEKFPQFDRKLRKSLEAMRMSQASAAAQTIKYAAVIDNCSRIVDEDPDFAKAYLRECRLLLQKMQQGDPDLYMRALHTVNDQMERARHSHIYSHSNIAV